jgi:hypothetical protein
VTLLRVGLGSLVMTVGIATAALAQEPACAPLYAAAAKALDQPGISRTITVGDPASPSMSLEARKTTDGWFQKRGGTAWQPMRISPDVTERRLLKDPGAFTSCVGGATEQVNGEAARVWSYVTKLGPAATPSKMWISVARGLPLKVQAAQTLQVSTYQATPFPKP